MQSFFRNILIAAALLAVPLAGTAQNAAAFLSVVPDARSAAMGYNPQIQMFDGF